MDHVVFVRLGLFALALVVTPAWLLLQVLLDQMDSLGQVLVVAIVAVVVGGMAMVVTYAIHRIYHFILVMKDLGLPVLI